MRKSANPRVTIESPTKRLLCPMSPEIVEAVQRVHARALQLGEMLLEVRQELGPVVWNHWLDNGCPIPAGAARRYANEAKRLRQAA